MEKYLLVLSLLFSVACELVSAQENDEPLGIDFDGYEIAPLEEDEIITEPEEVLEESIIEVGPALEIIEPEEEIESISTIETNQNTENLDDIEVLGVEEVAPSFDIDPNNSSTTISLEEIKRRNPINVMELVQDVAGVTTVGGTRTNGQGFNIRGFSDNEDILVTIDGARQNFERYRYGSGVDIEPDLLKQIEVVRGNSVRSGGSGTVGGSILMETKNARDLLQPQQQYGLELKTGYNTNDNLRKGGFTAYAQPLKHTDFLFNIIKNSSNDITLPDGSRLENSQTKQLSSLSKIGIFGIDFDIDIGYRYSNESVLEPFDITGNSGIGGLVRRTRTTRSPTLNLNWDPKPLWLNIDATIAYNDQAVIDEESSFANGGGTDQVEYKILNLDLKNRSEFSKGQLLGIVDIGIQSSRERREYLRIAPNGTVGFNEAQPPGEKQSYGAYVDTELSWNNWSWNGGVRYDDYSVSAGGATEEALELQNRSKKNGFDMFNFGTGLSFKPNGGPLLLFYNFGTSFRAPLIDEYYTLGATSRCRTFSTFVPRPVIPPATPLDLIAWEANPFRDTRASCGDFYEPEKTYTHEIGLSFEKQNLFSKSDSLRTKMTFFFINTENLIESIYQNSVTGEISQPGIEERYGWEYELNYDSDTWFSALAISLLDGHVSFNYFENNSNPSVQAIGVEDQGESELFNVPGDSLSLSLGKKIPLHFMEFGYRLRINGTRIAAGENNTSIPGCAGAGFFSIPSCITKVREGGYTTHGLFFNWYPNDNLFLGLTFDNITNKQYSTMGFGGVTGVPAAGRGLRLSLEYNF